MTTPPSSNTAAGSDSEVVGSPLNDVFEEQEGKPGVKYTSESGEPTWTPVVNRRNRRRTRLADPGFDSVDQVKELQSTIKAARDVTFQ